MGRRARGREAKENNWQQEAHSRGREAKNGLEEGFGLLSCVAASVERVKTLEATNLQPSYQKLHLSGKSGRVVFKFSELFNESTAFINF